MIEHFTLRTITDKVIVQRAAHFNRMHAEELPDDPLADPRDAVTRMRRLPAATRQHTWVVRDRGCIRAQASLAWTEREENRRLAHVYVSVERQLRRRGIGAQLLSLTLVEAIRARRPIVLSQTSDLVPAGRRFVERLGYRKGLEAHVNQLMLGRLDRDLMARWIKAGEERAGAYAVEMWDGPIPEADIVGFAGLAHVMNSQPRGNLDVEDTTITPEMIRDGERWLFASGNRRLIAYARHLPTGELAGYSRMSWSPKTAEIVWQSDTGVAPIHRNKGLGRWLKAFNIGELSRANPAARFVRTGNADSNAQMLAINHQMGSVALMAKYGLAGEGAGDRAAPAWAQGRCAACSRHGLPATRSLCCLRCDPPDQTLVADPISSDLYIARERIGTPSVIETRTREPS